MQVPTLNTYCGAKITHTAVGQFRGHFNGAMESYMHMRGFDLVQNSRSPATTHLQQ